MMTTFFARALAKAAIVCGSLAMSGLFAPVAQAQTLALADLAGLRFRAVRVDASAIAARSAPNYARRIETAVTLRAQEIFADRLAPGDRRAPTLVLKVDSLIISGDGGFSRRQRSRGASAFGDVNDYLEGEGLVVAPGGAVIARYPVLSSLGASYSGSTYISGADDRRISNIGWHFASWVRRNMGL